jgi:hypothetical protein
VLGSNLAQITGYPPEVFRSFPQSLNANSGIEVRLGHDNFHPIPLQFVTHSTATKLYKNRLDAQSVVK